MIKFYSILHPIRLAQIDSQKTIDFAQTSTYLKFLKLWVNCGSSNPLQLIIPKMKESAISLTTERAARPDQDRPESRPWEPLKPMTKYVISKFRTPLSACYFNIFHPVKSLKKPTKYHNIFDAFSLAGARLSDFKHSFVHESTHFVNPCIKNGFSKFEKT